jgi:putative transposase
VLDEAHLWNAIRYVEQNPVRAGIVSRAADYPWSSAAGRCGMWTDPLLAALPAGLPDGIGISNWADWLDGTLDIDCIQFLRGCTLTGRPCGDEAFVSQIAQTTNRSFIRRKPGPKPKDRQIEGQQEFVKGRDR